MKAAENDSHSRRFAFELIPNSGMATGTRASNRIEMATGTKIVLATKSPEERTQWLQQLEVASNAHRNKPVLSIC